MSIRYYGFPRRADGKIVAHTARVAVDDKAQDLPPRNDISNHAPAFAWGPLMIGQRQSKALVPGAAQLALALCCHALNNDGRALKLHKRFEFRVMGNWAADHAWAMTPEEIAAVCDQIEADEPSARERSTIANERAPIDVEPAVGRASSTTSIGHRNEIPGPRDGNNDDD